MPRSSLKHDDELGAELARFGIVSVPTTFFEWNGFRYTRADDAIAAAKRATPA